MSKDFGKGPYSNTPELKRVINSENRREVKVWGQNACHAIFAHRPNDIIKVFVDPERRVDAQPILDWCVAERRAFKLIPPAEIEKVTKSQHHEGIAMIILQKPELLLEELLDNSSKEAALVYLHSVGNPHNFGAIVRVAAFFGIEGLICGGGGAGTSGAAARVAQGGLEHLPLCNISYVDQMAEILRERDFVLVATAPHAKKSIYEVVLPKRGVYLFGAEGPGLPREVTKEADLLVSIPGAGNVESLNVACAASVVLAEQFRQRRIVPAR